MNLWGCTLGQSNSHDQVLYQCEKALPNGATGRSEKLWPLLRSVYTVVLGVKEDLPKWEPEESPACESG